MPIVLSHNEQLDLNLIAYDGSISSAQLEASAAYVGAAPDFLMRDTLNIVRENANFDTVPLVELDHLFGRYRDLYQPLNFQMLRRSAWLCFSPAAQAHIDHWSGKREVREAMSTTLRQFATYQEAGEWLLLSESETRGLESGAGFKELATIKQPPETGHLRAR